MSKIATLLALLCAIPAAHAQAPITVSRVSGDIVVQRDGSTEGQMAMELLVGSADAARTAGQQSLPYSPSLEFMEIVSAETRKADKRVLPVALDSIQERLLPAASGANDFDDRRAKIIVFPDVAAGDTIAFTMRRRSLRVLFPGQFANQLSLPPGVPWNEVNSTISMPSDMKLRTEMVGFTLDTSESGGRTLYRFHSGPHPIDSATRAVGAWDYAPRVFASTFKDWDEFAEALGALALPKAAVSPPVQALADEVTRGVTDRREQARLLYEWVSVNLRYVNVVLGIGGFEPHEAAEILAKRYGDCKDHVVALHALLAAKGIPAEMALINLGDLYTLPGPATFGHLNHIITYIPEFALYVDSTAVTAGLGTLVFSEYGKPVVHVGGGGPAVRRAPLLAPGVASVLLRTTALLEPDGVMKGTSTTEATGPFAQTLRAAAIGFRLQGGKAAETRLRANGLAGTGRFLPADTTKLDPSFSLSGAFTLDARREYLDGEAWPIPTGLRVISRPGDYLLGKIFDRPMRAEEPMPCWPGRQVEELSVTLPANRRLARVPRGVTVAAEGVAYSSAWQVDGQTVSVRRELTSTVAAPLCTGAMRAAMAPALDAIRADLLRNVALAEE